MGVVRVRTADESVQTLEFVYQPLFQQKIQRTIYRRRCWIAYALPQLIENLIRADRSVCRAHKFQHFAPLRGEPDAAFVAQRFR